MFKEKYGYLLENGKVSERKLRAVLNKNIKRLYDGMLEEGIKSPEGVLSDLTGIYHCTLWRYKENDNIPNLDSLVKIAYVCGLNLSDLLNDDVKIFLGIKKLKDIHFTGIESEDFVNEFINDFEEKYLLLKEETKMSDSMICELSGMHRNRLTDFKKKRVTIITMVDLIRLCLMFNCVPDDFFGWFLEGGDLNE